MQYGGVERAEANRIDPSELGQAISHLCASISSSAPDAQ